MCAVACLLENITAMKKDHSKLETIQGIYRPKNQSYVWIRRRSKNIYSHSDVNSAIAKAHEVRSFPLQGRSDRLMKTRQQSTPPPKKKKGKTKNRNQNGENAFSVEKKAFLVTQT